jgi:hypothetical protein
MLEYVRLGESREAIQEIRKASGVNLRTIYRARTRQLDWARENAKGTPPQEGHK